MTNWTKLTNDYIVPDDETFDADGLHKKMVDLVNTIRLMNGKVAPEARAMFREIDTAYLDRTFQPN